MIIFLTIFCDNLVQDMFVEQATIKLPVCKLQGREAEYEGMCYESSTIDMVF